MTSPLRLRGYAVGQLLGSGATSDVWAAHAIPSGAPVALKRIRIANAEQRTRARSEGALLAALENPNLVRLHTMAELDDSVVLVLDLADGGSLARLLSARGRLTAGEVITAISPIAAALDYLHDSGVVHSDISAANILFTASGVPMLADVGVARLTGDERDAEASPAYVDPAVAAGCVPAAQSDVFMLAGVALHALTGAPPWPDAEPAEALQRAAAGVLDVRDRLAAADVPEAMAAVLVRALDVDPQRRGTAADLALDLAHSGTAVAVDLTAGTVPGRGPEIPPTRLVARPRPVITRPPPQPATRRLPLLLAVAAVIVVAAAGTAWKVLGATDGHRSTANSRSHLEPQPRSAEMQPPSAETTPAPGETAPPSVETQPRSAELTLPVGAASPPGSTTSSANHTGGTRNWLAELRRLDAVRSRAFGRRQPALLERVYVPGPLLRADRAMMLRLVPPGCRLVGAETTYSRARVVAKQDSAVVTTTAALAPSQLSCADGRRARTTAAVIRMRFVLRTTPVGVRIAGLRTASGPPSG